MKYIAFLFIILSGSVSAVQPGLYHVPDEPGHGLAIYNAPDGFSVATWYTYNPIEDSAGDPLEQRQAWLITDNFLAGQPVDLFKPSGSFLDSEFALGAPVGEIVITPDGSGLLVEFSIWIWSQNCEGGSIFQGPCRGVRVFERLTPAEVDP